VDGLRSRPWGSDSALENANDNSMALRTAPCQGAHISYVIVLPPQQERLH
jgi:hypothetical protein